jgi:predicted TIM-barrel fold metal-dependent hydrolase
MKLIDAHAHLCHNPKGLDKVVESGRFEQIWLMDLGACELGFHDFASEDEVLQASKEYPGFFIPFGFLDLRKSPDEVDRLKERGFVGLKPYRPVKPWSHPDYFPFYERAKEMNMPILFHTGIVDKAPLGSIGKGMSHGPGMMKPSYLADIASAFPDLTIIAGHLGYPWLEETALNLYYYPNIYHDLSGYRKDIEWLIKNLDRKCNDGYEKLRFFNDKILFATDAISYGSEKGHEEAFKLADFWELFLEMIGGYYYRWGEPEERKKILYANAKKLYEGFSK